MAVRDDAETAPPILRCKDHQAPSVFTPEALLREARRQKGVEVRRDNQGENSATIRMRIWRRCRAEGRA